jgi:DNA-binding transcriptional MerR regulator
MMRGILAMSKEYSNLNIRIPKELHQKLKDACYQRRDSITDVLVKAINDYLENNENNDDNEDIVQDRAEIDQLKQDNSKLEQRLERLENWLEEILNLVSSKVSRDEIEMISPRLSLCEDVQVGMSESLEKLEKRESELSQRIVQLENQTASSFSSQDNTANPNSTTDSETEVEQGLDTANPNSASDSASPLLTSSEAAKEAGVSPRTIREHTHNAKNKRLTYIKTNGTVWKIVETPDEKVKTKYTRLS